jgi:glycosyltransferase involved in cell wall biosynthesis
VRVLLIGHGCCPGMGSEPGLTWNWAWHLSRDHQMCVVAHPWSKPIVEDYLAKHPNPSLRFCWVKPPDLVDPWDPKLGEKWLRLHYLLWQQAVLRKAKELHRSQPFDLIHHVGWGTVSAPPLLWRLGAPFIWGPIGGGQAAPSAFRTYFGNRWGQELLRKGRLKILGASPRLSNAAKNSAIVLTTNGETARQVTRAGARRTLPFLDNGLATEFMPAAPQPRTAGKTLRLLWAGRLEYRKALPLALEAIAQLPDAQVELLIAGDGPQRKVWEQRAAQLGLGAKVRFLGMVNYREMPGFFRSADAFIFTSLRDAFGSVVLEAMAHALPVITLDHQGVGHFLPLTASFKAPVTTPAETIPALADAIRRLGTSFDLRQNMGLAAYQFAEGQRWDKRGEQMSQLYQSVFYENRNL